MSVDVSDSDLDHMVAAYRDVVVNDPWDVDLERRAMRAALAVAGTELREEWGVRWPNGHIISTEELDEATARRNAPFPKVVVRRFVSEWATT